MLAGSDLRLDRDARRLLLALPARPRGRALPEGGEAGADRRGAGDAAAAGGRQPLRRGGHERAEHEDRRLGGAVEHLPAVRLLALPDRRLHGGRPDAEASRSRSRDSSRTWPPARSTARCRASTSSRSRSSASTAAATTCRTSGSIYWSMRVMAFAGVLMFLVAALGAWLYWKQKLEKARWFLWTAIVAIALPVHRRDRRLDPHRDGAPALDRAGPAARPRDANSPNVSTTWLGDQPRLLRHPLRRPRRRRLRADAPLRATRPAGAARRTTTRRRR